MEAQPTDAPYCTRAQLPDTSNTHSTDPSGMAPSTLPLYEAASRRFSLPLQCTVAHWLMAVGVSVEVAGGVPENRSAAVGA